MYFYIREKLEEYTLGILVEASLRKYMANFYQ